MKKLTTHLWFDREAKEAAHFYASVFDNSRINNISVLNNTPSGSVDIVSMEILGEDFTLISAGPYFKFNPSISFMINFDPSGDHDARENIDNVWEKLSEGGEVLFPIREYPWSKRYGWIQDKFGLSWQLILTNPEGEGRPALVPTLLFTKDVYGMAEEAAKFYLSVFRDSKMGAIMRYGAGQEPNREGAVMFEDFRIFNLWFAAMDGESDKNFVFNESVSFMVHCDTQDEIDYYWGKLSAVPESEQCGWLKDRYGLSWQIVPSIMDEMMRDKDNKKTARVTEAFLKMKKFDIGELKKAFEGQS